MEREAGPGNATESELALCIFKNWSSAKASLCCHEAHSPLQYLGSLSLV